MVISRVLALVAVSLDGSPLLFPSAGAKLEEIWAPVLISVPQLDTSITWHQ